VTRGFTTTRVLLQQQALETSHALTLDRHSGPRACHPLRRTRESARQCLECAFPIKPGDVLNLRDMEQAIENFRRVPSAQAEIVVEPVQGFPAAATWSSATSSPATVPDCPSPWTTAAPKPPANTRAASRCQLRQLVDAQRPVLRIAEQRPGRRRCRRARHARLRRALLRALRLLAAGRDRQQKQLPPELVARPFCQITTTAATATVPKSNSRASFTAMLRARPRSASRAGSANRTTLSTTMNWNRSAAWSVAGPLISITRNSSRRPSWKATWPTNAAPALLAR
jgi:hypothetical protein